MRVIFSIILNGLHHLLHNDQYKFILNNCDKWIVVEGASKSNGTTSWCKSMPDQYHNNGASVDGTREFLHELSLLEPKLIYIPSNGFWHSKDIQVNRAIEELKKITNKCFLWEFDIDEQWTSDAMNQAEKEMIEQNVKSASFRADCYIGKNLMAIGEWGECVTGGYPRMWYWEGENFKCHEPPVLENTENKLSKVLSPRFTHYNYYFEKDVKFKDSWYGGHEQIYERWKYLNSLPKEAFPVRLSALISGYWGTTNSAIIWKNNQ